LPNAFFGFAHACQTVLDCANGHQEEIQEKVCKLQKDSHPEGVPGSQEGARSGSQKIGQEDGRSFQDGRREEKEDFEKDP
jgi:hypothetical protein